MAIRRVGPMEIKLLHDGEEHTISMERGTGKLWDIHLDGDHWASGRRLKQCDWCVYRDGHKQRGRTLETAVTTMFYQHMRDLG